MFCFKFLQTEFLEIRRSFVTARVNSWGVSCNQLTGLILRRLIFRNVRSLHDSAHYHVHQMSVIFYRELVKKWFSIWINFVTISITNHCQDVNIFNSIKWKLLFYCAQNTSRIFFFCSCVILILRKLMFSETRWICNFVEIAINK